MGSSATPVGGLPPLPTGATLSSSTPPPTPSPSTSGTLPPLPAGAKLANAPTPAPTGLSDNPNGEGTYQMQGPSGNVSVPYSKVTTATQHGYNLADTDAPRYAKDAANDPVKQLADLNKGFTGALSQTGRTAEKALTGVPVLGRILANSKGFQESEAADEQRANAPNDTPAAVAGSTIENILEFAAGDEALKGLTWSEKLAKLAPVAKLMEKSPWIANALDTAIKSGVVGTAQAGAHGADVGTAAATGAVTGATGGLLEGGMGALLHGAEKVAPAVEDIAGEKVQTLSSQRPGTGPRGSVKVNEVPSVGAEQQAAAPRVFKNIAQRATHNALEEANQGRVVANKITNPARLLAAPEDARPYPFTIEGTGTTEESIPGGNDPRVKQIGTEYVPGKGSATAAKSEPYNEGAFKYGDEEPLPLVRDQEPFTGPTHKEPILQYLTDLKPGQTAGSTSVTGGGDIVAANPEAAQTHLSRLNDILDNPHPDMTPQQIDAVTQARDSLSEQMDMYHAYQRTLPNFNPINSAEAAQSVDNFGAARDQLQNAATPIYQKLDKVSDGEFGRLNRERAAAGKRGDFTKQYQLEGQIRNIIDSSDGITHGERAQASALWSKSMVLDGLHSAVEHAANVNERYASEVAGGRVLSGVRLQNGLNRLINQYGADRIESVIGKDGMENMTRMSNLLNTPKGASGFKGMSMSVMHNLMHGKVGGAAGAVLGHHLGGWEGAVAGSYAGAQAERWMLQQAATNPRIGQLIDYAVRNNVTPKVAAGLISSAIIQENQPPQEDNTEERAK